MTVLASLFPPARRRKGYKRMPPSTPFPGTFDVRVPSFFSLLSGIAFRLLASIILPSLVFIHFFKPFALETRVGDAPTEEYLSRNFRSETKEEVADRRGWVRTMVLIFLTEGGRFDGGIPFH